MIMRSEKVKKNCISGIREKLAQPLASIFLFLILGSCIWSQWGIYDVSKIEFPSRMDACNYDFYQDFMIEDSEGGTIGYKVLDLSYGDSFLVSGRIQPADRQDGTEGSRLVLYSSNGIILSCAEIITDDDGFFESRLDYYRTCNPTDAGILLLYFEKDVELISGLTVERDEMAAGMDTLLKLLFGVLCVADILILVCLVSNLVYFARNNGEDIKKGINVQLELKPFRIYALIVLVIIVSFFFINRGWDLRLPYIYARDVSDTKFLFTSVKMIDKGGINLIGWEELGGHDVYRSLDFYSSDRLHTLLIWVIGRLSDNVFIVTNMLYIAYYLLNGVAAGYVCKKLGYSDKMALVVSGLFSMSVFAQMRYNHLVYVGYFMVPFAILLAVRTMRGEFEKADSKKTVRIWSALLIMFVTANTGLYYTYFACYLLVIAIIYALVNKVGRKTVMVAAASLGSAILGVLFNLSSSILYTFRNGVNSYSDVNNRQENDVVKYGLSLLQLLFPRYNHRVPFLSDITQKYIDSWDFLRFDGHDFKNLFINENLSSTAGLIADIGMIILLLMMLKKNKKEIFGKYGILFSSCLLLGLVSCGGSVIGYLINLPVRSYNRISIVIVFIALLGFAEFMDGVIKKQKYIIQFFIVAAVLIVGILDQNVDYSYSDGHVFFLEQSDFMEKIDEKMSDGSRIFCLPYWNWISDGQRNYMMGAAETDGLIWSCGAEQGREEAIWQKGIAGLAPDEMLAALANAGYDGVFLDKYDSNMPESDFENLVLALTEASGTEPMVSENGSEYFWILNRQASGTE